MNISDYLDKDSSVHDLLKPFGNLGSCFCFSKPKKTCHIVYIIAKKLNKTTFNGLQKAKKVYLWILEVGLRLLNAALNIFHYGWPA